MPKHLLLSFLLSVLAGIGHAQMATVSGTLKNEKGNPLEAASIGVPGTRFGTTSKQDGSYSLQVPASKEITLVFRHIGFKEIIQKLTLQEGESRVLEITMESSSVTFTTFEVTDERGRERPMSKIDVDIADFIPSVTNSVEALLQSQALGVSSNNELSTQYSVRGGNFDENLVYVNGIEVYRPFLIRSGQQEGLSFVNSDLVESVDFSSGGFEARYGDKMSSVLDITYKKPEKLAGSVSGGFLGANIHLENASDNRRFTQIHGFRYFTNQYVLGSLDETGDYRPNFMDYQTYLTYGINTEWSMSFLGNISRNRYRFVPEDRTSSFGTVSEAIALNVFFNGSEVNEYLTAFGAFTTTYKPSAWLTLNATASAFRTQETESFDIEGAYRLSELEKDLGKSSLGEETFVLGTGSFLNHARNYLDANVASLQVNGTYQRERHRWSWGLKYRMDQINDRLSEWEMVDSVGFSVPYDGEEVNLFETIKSENDILTNRVMGYLQRDWYFDIDSAEVFISTGARFHYWDFNGQTTFSPRILGSIKPNWERDWQFRASWGYYHQPAFYRETRDLFGQVNPEIRAQTSIHYLVGADYNLKIYNRPFKIVTEAYYKQLKDLIPYELDNVRIRYYATNNANGYATGADFKINGEFVKGVDSWMSISVLKTEEDLVDDDYVQYLNAEGEVIVPGVTADRVVADSVTVSPGFIARPTDQRVSFALTFQDYLPRNENLKMHLSMIVGTGLPTGPPSYTRYKDVFRMPPYRRVDIGFSALLKGEDKELPGNPLNVLKSVWATLEVWNLLAVNNTISYTWVKDSRNIEYGVPNYLTQRRVNLKLIAKF